MAPGVSTALSRRTVGLLAASLLVAGLTVGSAEAREVAIAGNPLEMSNGFYTDPNSNPAVWARDHAGDTRTATIKSAIAEKPGARWFGNWSGDIRTAVDSYTYAADIVDKLPILVAYNIPSRDCNGDSSGGAGSPDAYRTWISQFAAGIGGKPAVVIIEPDALAQLDCLTSNAARQTRQDLLRYAATQFAQLAPNTWAYLDGGNATWIPAATMAQRLDAVGVRTIRGFTINVSNFYPTASSASYGNAVNASLSSQHGYTAQFVVDTSRNGNGSNGEWCNPAGRKLGVPSQVGGGAEMLLWGKVPGDSDGDCGVVKGIPAGTFSPDLATHLINGN
jgi:endoglucanase